MYGFLSGVNNCFRLPWIYVKPLMLHKYNKIMDNFLADYSSEFLQITPNPSFSILFRFCRIPFTIQRLCELLENPFRHYTRPDKFLRGLEKVTPNVIRTAGLIFTLQCLVTSSFTENKFILPDSRSKRAGSFTYHITIGLAVLCNKRQ
ncbi:unnamed protein product [Echinostoma caproni]|uniref:Uncharacterized protein n=1 Tax=Echinostoma caproni TaxID=27848 RepID=A0A183BC31_9TREM|nr:unnamed protein product [Echinostoma caproni]